MAQDIRSLIDELGGVTEVARELGHKHHTTVQAWHRTGKLPQWRKAEVVALARRKKVSVPRELNHV